MWLIHFCTCTLKDILKTEKEEKEFIMFFIDLMEHQKVQCYDNGIVNVIASAELWRQDSPLSA
jgi:hypothetical protein